MLPLGAADNLFPLEVHIRTGEMHRLAQYGIACERWVGAGPCSLGIMFIHLVLSRLHLRAMCCTSHVLSLTNYVVNLETPAGLLNDAWCCAKVAKFRSSGSLVEAPAPLPKSPTESELAPIDSRVRLQWTRVLDGCMACQSDDGPYWWKCVMQDGEATDLATGQRHSLAAAAAQDQELVRGPLNGTKLNGAPKNSALNGVKINGTHVSRFTCIGTRHVAASLKHVSRSGTAIDIVARRVPGEERSGCSIGAASTRSQPGRGTLLRCCRAQVTVRCAQLGGANVEPHHSSLWPTWQKSILQALMGGFVCRWPAAAAAAASSRGWTSRSWRAASTG